MTNQSPHAKPKNVTTPKGPVGAKGPSKKTQLIKILSRKSGADAVTISSKFGWQPHTTRAALSGLRKAGFDIAKENTGIGKLIRYRIESAPDASAAGGFTDGK